MTRLFIAFALVLAACQQELDGRAKELYDEELAKLEGEMWPAINSDNFGQMQIGSSYEEAVSLLGPGEEVSRTESAGQSIVIYQWMRPDGANISLTFSNNALVSKAQAGL